MGYAVGTQGLGNQCAPSRQLAAGSEYEGAFLKGLRARGYAVTVTDYEGLGTEGVHTYIVRGPVGLAGYSQGGGASASAAELAPTYAPELNIKGAYAGAVPADLDAVNGISAAYDIDTAPYVNASGRQKLKANQSQCVFETIAASAFLRTNTATTSGKKVSVLINDEPFRSVVAQQKIGVGRAPKVPVLIGQSLLDDVIPYQQDKALAKRWCDQGSKVRFRPSAAPTHVGGAVALFPAAFAFLEARFAGLPAVSSCSTL